MQASFVYVRGREGEIVYVGGLCGCVCAFISVPSFNLFWLFQSVVALESHQYSEGDVLHMKLMKRRKVCGGGAYPPAWGGVLPYAGVMCA